MNKNTFSLLSSNWMFANNGESALYPFLFNIINGVSQPTGTLQTTEYFFQGVSGMRSGTNPEDLPSLDSVAVLKVHHPIFKYNQFCGPQGTQTMINTLEEWKNETSIKGVVLDLNSPGGQVSGTAEFAEYIANYPKPIVSFTKDLIGSAAYYIASASKSIIAHKHADFIGCIGTMMKSINIEGVLEKKGATIHELYSDLSPEKNKQSRALKNGDPKPLISEILNPMAQQFHNDVKAYRPQVSEKALKGDIFSPASALEEGLIDEIGTLKDAIDKVLELSKNNKSQKQTTMSQEFTRIQAALGMESAFEMNENGVFINQEQLQTIEDLLDANATAIDGAPEAIETAVTEATEPLNARIAELEGQDTEAVTAAIDTALATAEVERENLTNVEAVEQLSNLVVEYGQLDGAKPTKTIDDGTTGESDNPNMVGGYDISKAMNN